MPPTATNSAMEREQLASIVRRLMIDADDFFVQQQKTLQLSYAELNSRIDHLRTRVQQQQQQQQQQHQVGGLASNNGGYSSMNPSPFSTVHSLPMADVLGMSGTGQSGVSGNAANSNVNATPLRTVGNAGGGAQGYGGNLNNSATANNNGASRSLLSSLNGPSAMAAMSEAGLESGRFTSVAGGGMNGGSGGFLGSASTNGATLTGGVRGAYRAAMADAITPPNKQLALSQSTSKSPSMAQATHTTGHGNGSAVYDDPITSEYFSTAPNASAGAGSHHDSLMASPQASQKLSLEELIERFNMSTASVNAAATAFNFDSLYEQLTSGGPEETSQSPLDYTDSSRSGMEKYTSQTASPYARSGNFHNGGGGGDRDEPSPDANVFGTAAAKNSIPVDSLRAVHDQHLTTSVRVVYEQGRPKVVKVPGGAADTPEALGINSRSSCEVLVEFKRKRVLQYESNEYVAPGSYVIVGGDRGEDLGLVVYAWCEVSSDGSKANNGSGKRRVVGVGLTDSKLPRSMGVGNGTVLRVASDIDVQQLLGTQAELERRAIDVCAQLVLDHSLPMVIVDAEYQFDKKKLTFFYEAQQRMDFRELVRHLYKTFRARIWMELVDA